MKRMSKSHKSRKDRYLRRTYGLTFNQWEKIAKLQDYVCFICERKPNSVLQVDHDHKTGRVRGLLCGFCNYKFLGRGRERPEMHERATIYLRRDFDGRKL